MPADWPRSRLVWVLRWIAAEPDAALGALRFSADGPIEVPADEIALSLEDVWLPIKENELLDAEIRSRVEEIDDLFASISGHTQSDHWTYEAVTSDPVWQAAREKARDLLAFLGESRDDEHLFGNV